jgi:hypothetical protein
MRRLELKDIAGYFPYDLRAVWCKKEYRCLSLIKRNNIFIAITEDNMDETHNPISAIEHIVPILRPLDDLYQTITHNGRKIVPIVECARKAFPGRDWKIVDGRTFCQTKEGYTFEYDEGYNVFCLERDYCIDQILIFDYLHELKIDYRGLISEGLAIDANTLDINPYK